MTRIVQVVLLAIVQGLTEFLPVSSTAHLYLSSWLLGRKPEGLEFDISLHLGTLLALVVYFFPDWVQILGQGFGYPIGHDEALRHNPDLLWFLALGSLPVGVAGLLLHKWVEGAWRNPVVMGIMLISVGILIGEAERWGTAVRSLASVSVGDALRIGFVQVLALIPGTSRSGITIASALSLDFSREAAARFSFLLSTPAIAAATGHALYGMHREKGLPAMLNAPFLTGVLVSAVTGSFVIGWFLRYLRYGGFGPFVYYRVIFGIMVLALAFYRRPAG